MNNNDLQCHMLQLTIVSGHCPVCSFRGRGTGRLPQLGIEFSIWVPGLARVLAANKGLTNYNTFCQIVGINIHTFLKFALKQ